MTSFPMKKREVKSSEKSKQLFQKAAAVYSQRQPSEPSLAKGPETNLFVKPQLAAVFRKNFLRRDPI